MERQFFRKAAAILSMVVVLANFMGMTAKGAVVDGGKEEQGVEPQYLISNAVSCTDHFDVGSDRVTIKFWVDYFRGGVTLSSINNCDFRVDGYVMDTDRVRHKIYGGADETTYCECTAVCPSMRNMIEVYAEVGVSSSDGSADYAETAGFVWAYY